MHTLKCSTVSSSLLKPLDFNSMGNYSLYIVLLQIALDTFYWNPLMHLVVWGSILAWFVVIPITSSETLYGDFFQYGGVAYEVMSSPNFWFYLPLAAIIALLPTIVYRFINLYRQPTYVDFVRLKEKKEGKKLFKRKKLAQRSRSRHSVNRTGYAFSHQHGFGALISSGHIFGMNKAHVSAEHNKRHSRLTSASPAFPEFMGSGDHRSSSVSVSQAVTKVRESNVKIDVVETDTVCSNTAADTAAVANLSVEVHEMSPPPPYTEEMEMVVRTDRERDGSVEQTDLVIVPHVSIPGLVESPDASKDREQHEMSPVEQTDSAIVPPASIPGLVDSPEVTEDKKPEDPVEVALGADAVGEGEDKEHILDVV